MWALGFIFLIFVYVMVVGGICTESKAENRQYIILISCVFPLLLPFSYYLKPSYYKFQSLCNQSDRYIVEKKIALEYAPPFHWCDKGAFNLMIENNYLGYDCTEKKNPNNMHDYSKTYFRFVPNEKWSTEVCQSACFHGNPFEWKETCQDICFSKTELSGPSVDIDFRFENKELVENAIVKSESLAVDSNLTVIARSINYEYYLYGNGIAKILGLASGEAPTLSCKVKTDLFKNGFLEKRAK